jgi:hypothetical protein
LLFELRDFEILVDLIAHWTNGGILVMLRLNAVYSALGPTQYEIQTPQ